jgi:DNA repair photolyase
VSGFYTGGKTLTGKRPVSKERKKTISQVPVTWQSTGHDMTLMVKEVCAKSILSPSKIYPWVINPYTGCQHGCSYCYARFMKRVTGHREPWGEFVDVKINAADLLRREILKKKRGRVWLSGVCDPYQPLEATYRLTRQCLEILVQNNWPVIIQTRSPLVLRDLDILRAARDVEAGLSVTTADDRIRKLFEPDAPPVSDRIRVLEELHNAGIRTYAMIAPVLPGAEGLAALLKGKIDYVIIDQMNYHYADQVYRKYGMEDKLTDEYFYRIRQEFDAL